MAATAFNTTTLSEALIAETAEFAVASTANIVAKDLLVIRGEVVKVQAVPVSGRVQVMRGVQGTAARAHASGQRVFIIANPEDTKTNTAGQWAVVGASGVYPDYLFPGQRARDGAGNEYILCEFSAVAYSGTTVLISQDGLYTAAVLSSGEQGSVGILVEGVTSDQYAWVQVYGYNSYAQESQGDSAVSSLSLACAASSNSTPDVGLAVLAASSFTSAVLPAHQYLIEGMFVVGSATTATTSAASATGVAVPVFLNYPYVKRVTVETITNITSA